MIELDDGSFIPRECCTVTNPITSGGKNVIDDIELPCGADCGGDCTECVIQKIMDEYAVLTGQKLDLNNRHCEDCMNYVALSPGVRGGKRGFCKVRRQAEARRGRGKACKRFKEKRHEQETEKDLEIQELKKENRKLREENQQLRKKLPKWIPVKEKLPECENENGDETPVWVTHLSYFDEKTPICGILAIYDHECDCWRWYDETLAIYEMERCRVEITAWIPTPTEPYKPEEVKN